MSMATVTFDKLSYSQTLRNGGFTPEQAETSVHTLDSALRDSVATRADVEGAKVELDHKIDASVAALENRLDASVAALDHRIDHSVAVLRQEMVSQRHDMMKWIIPLFLGQAALIVAMTKLI